ncbi:PhzF family phenazine biosynthesis protein [Candidatus Bathyarchaeota archaeon]|nr:PhzF family phenazine biosynthesis protein [Candidatus Bathyarchaeota archaeon]
MNLPFHIVDVFAEEKYAGNQLAVFRDEEGLPGELMQRIAKEMNFQESTFITGVDLDSLVFKVRIFTKERELPFAGHPTLGTAYVIQKAIVGRQVENVTLDLKAGMIPVTFSYVDGEANVLWMKQLNPVFGETHPPEPVAEFLGLEPEDIDADWPIQEVSTGVPFFMIPLRTRDAVVRTRINREKLAAYTQATEAKSPLVFCREPVHPENHLKVRMIGSTGEDPATGSANGCLAGYLAKHRYFGGPKVDVRVEQGHEIGRPSLLYLRSEDRGEEIDVYVGGKNVMVAKGEFI